MCSVPDGWVVKTLGEVVETINGLWVGKKEPYVSAKAYTMSNFTKDCEINHLKKPREIQVSVAQYKGRKLEYGDLLLEKSGGGENQPVGRVIYFDIINNENNTFSNFTTRLRLNDKCKEFVDSNFVHKYLKLIYINGGTKKFQKNSTNIRNLQLKEYLQLQIPIPPLAEQKCIVSILDKAFTEITKAKANAEQNLKNTKELFKNYLQDVFENKGDDWDIKTLGDLGEVQTGTTPPTKDKLNYGSFIPFAKPPHFNSDGSVDTGASMLSEQGLKKSRLFKSNSILMVCIGATIGKTGFTKTPITSNQQINALTPNNNYEYKFLYYALISPNVQKQIMQIGRSAQATLPIISKSKWNKLKVNILKNKQLQIEIINNLDALQNQTKKLETIYQQKIAILDELKKSVLQKAFNGELV